MTTRADHVDVVVIGLGPAGEHVAGRLAEAGLAVVGIECGLVGGECAYWGCVPTKMMVGAAGLLAAGRRIDGRAGRAVVRPDWSPVVDRVRDAATGDWDDAAAVDRLTGKDARFVRDRGRLVGPRQVEAGGRVFSAARGVVLATGARPVIPPVPGLAGTPYWTNREAVEAKEVPASLAVLGGGAIGMELAQVFQRFGSEVTVIETAGGLLPAEEPDAGRIVAETVRAEGMTVLTGCRAVAVRHAADVFTVSTDQGPDVSAERLLVATGRRPALDGLGLEAAGVDAVTDADTGMDAVPTSGRMRAGPWLWAVGDVTGLSGFTHVAAYQAEIAVRDILGMPGPEADYRAVPRVTFTDPEVGAVGLTEAAARRSGVGVRTAVADRSTRGWLQDRAEQCLVKLVADADRGVLVGATCVGPAGGEVLFGLTMAVRSELPVADLADAVLAYPTFHRDVQSALRKLL